MLALPGRAVDRPLTPLKLGCYVGVEPTLRDSQSRVQSRYTNSTIWLGILASNQDFKIQSLASYQIERIPNGNFSRCRCDVTFARQTADYRDCGCGKCCWKKLEENDGVEPLPFRVPRFSGPISVHTEAFSQVENADDEFLSMTGFILTQKFFDHQTPCLL